MSEDLTAHGGDEALPRRVRALASHLLLRQQDNALDLVLRESGPFLLQVPDRELQDDRADCKVRLDDSPCLQPRIHQREEQAIAPLLVTPARKAIHNENVVDLQVAQLEPPPCCCASADCSACVVIDAMTNTNNVAAVLQHLGVEELGTEQGIGKAEEQDAIVFDALYIVQRSRLHMSFWNGSMSVVLSCTTFGTSTEVIVPLSHLSRHEPKLAPSGACPTAWNIDGSAAAGTLCSWDVSTSMETLSSCPFSPEDNTTADYVEEFEKV